VRPALSTPSIARLIGATLILANLPSAAAAWTNWVSGAPAPAADTSQAAATIDGMIYMVGGFNTGNLASLYAYNPVTNVWSSKSPLPGPRYAGNGAGVINGQLYIAGGWTQSPPLPHDDLFIYNPASNSWSSGASLSHLSGCGATGVINGKLYVYSPCNGFSGYVQTLDVYNPATNAWTNLAASSAQHVFPASAVINGKLYLAGGGTTTATASNVVEVYDPVPNGWTTLAPMPVAVAGAISYATIDGRLLVLGGTDAAGTPVANGQLYNPVTNKWSTSKALPAPLTGGAGAVDYGFYYVLGGAASGTPSTTNERITATPILP
jgi:N-acetylneuraminic acid mutarotase